MRHFFLSDRVCKPSWDGMRSCQCNGSSDTPLNNKIGLCRIILHVVLITAFVLWLCFSVACHLLSFSASDASVLVKSLLKKNSNRQFGLSWPLFLSLCIFKIVYAFSNNQRERERERKRERERERACEVLRPNSLFSSVKENMKIILILRGFFFFVVWNCLRHRAADNGLSAISGRGKKNARYI